MKKSKDNKSIWSVTEILKPTVVKQQQAVNQIKPDVDDCISDMRSLDSVKTSAKLPSQTWSQMNASYTGTEIKSHQHREPLASGHVDLSRAKTLKGIVP